MYLAVEQTYSKEGSKNIFSLEHLQTAAELHDTCRRVPRILRMHFTGFMPLLRRLSSLWVNSLKPFFPAKNPDISCGTTKVLNHASLQGLDKVMREPFLHNPPVQRLPTTKSTNPQHTPKRQGSKPKHNEQNWKHDMRGQRKNIH